MYGIRTRKGFIALIGKVGTGKTTVVCLLSPKIVEEVAHEFRFDEVERAHLRR
jgi:dephospho-CoA kinase